MTRLFAVDALKAAAIIAVVLTHSGPIIWEPGYTSTDRLLRSHLIAFCVPMFFLVAGYLQGQRPASLRSLGTRLVRITVPYVFATLVMHIVWWQTSRDLAWNLATGSAWGIYYFVPAYVMTLLLLWPLIRLPVIAVAVAGVLAMVALRSPPYAASFLWAVRDPILQGFLLCAIVGWLAAQVPAAPPRWLWGFAGALLIVVSFGLQTGIARALYTFGVAAMIVVIARPWPVARWLDDATLTIYLYHPLFLEPLNPRVAGWPPILRILVLVSVGLGGSALLVTLGRRVLGARSRLLLGA